MPSHQWGDAWFEKHGDDLNKAIYFIMDNWRRWGRISSHGKEKYGCFQDYVYFYNAWWPVHDLIKPGRAGYRWNKRLMRIEMWFGKHIVRPLRIHNLVYMYQKMVYNAVVQIACRRWPDIVDELVADLDGYNLIKPGFFGKVDGVVIHNKYWKKE